MPKKRTNASLAPRRGGLTCTKFDIASEAVANGRATGATVLQMFSSVENQPDRRISSPSKPR